MHSRVRVLLGTLTLLIHGVVHPAVVFEGTVPADLDRAFLSREYRRLDSLLGTQVSPDSTPIVAIYYAERNRPDIAALLPEWGGGGAVGPDTVLVPVDKPFAVERNLTAVTLHEIVHCVIRRRFSSAPVPRWFHEGCAMTLSGEISFEEQALLAREVFIGRLMPLASVDSVNLFPLTRARLAYSQSHASLLFLIDTYGFEAIPEILQAADQTHDFDSGMQRSLGLSQLEFETLAGQYIHRRYGLVFLFGDLYFVWLLILVLAVGGYIVTKVRNRRRARLMALMEAAETQPGQQPPGTE
jgi:hypothetical protein